MTNVPTIIADENMPALELFSGLGEVRTVPGRPLPRAALTGAQALLVRSVTRVDEALLAGTSVRFVGSATIGTDHVDLDYLARAGIRFAHAPGCNAMAVAEYVLQAVLAWALDNGRALQRLRVGLVGLGNVGRSVAGLLEAVGCTVVASDPPQVEAGAQTAVPLGTLEQVLACDVISLHVPLTTAGPHPTHHLLDAARLAALTPAQLLINTCRGPVIDNRALLARLEAGQGPVTVLDVWEQEPQVPPALLAAVWRGSPHIAGYSVEGKVRGTWMLYRALGQWLGVDASRAMPQQAPVRAWEAPVASMADLLALLRTAYRPEEDHRLLREAMGLPPEGGSRETWMPLTDVTRGTNFDQLRKTYRVRHETAGLRVTGAVAPVWQTVLSRLGVVVSQ